MYVLAAPLDYVADHIYIVGFRSIYIHRAEERCKRGHKVGLGPHHAARKWGPVVHHLFPS
jgi:hypothetical protein